MSKELNLIIQGNYGYGWEDVSYYPCGFRQINYSKALRDCLHDLKEYNISGTGIHRYIKRYEEYDNEK